MQRRMRCGAPLRSNCGSGETADTARSTGQREFPQVVQVIVLDVDLQRSQQAHHAAVNGNDQEQIDDTLMIEAFAQLRERLLGQIRLRGQFARGTQRRARKRRQIGGLTCALRSIAWISSSVTPNSRPILT